MKKQERSEHSMTRAVIVLALTLTGIAGVASLARADDPANEAIWKRYWMAIDAQRQCNNVDFSQGQYDAMVHVINQKINFDLGAGIRHQLMSDANSEVQDMAFKYGCHSPQLTDLLNLYNSDLAPVVQ
jgi:hypothetical protein